MASDREIIKGIQASQAATISSSTTGGPVDPVGEVKKMHRVVADCPITDGGTAGTAVTEMTFFLASPAIDTTSGTAYRVKAAYISTPVTAAANGSNFVTWTLAKRTDGGGSTSIGTLATSATGNTAFAKRAMTLTAANVDLAAGDELTIAAAKSGTGVAFASATAQAHVYVILEAV